MLHRKIGVGKGLRLNALRGVDDEQRALTRRERARDLVVEVDVARRVDEVEGVDLAVGSGIVEGDGARLDGDAALALQVHVVEDLIRHLARGDGIALFKQPVRQRRLAVVNVGDDTEISDVLFVHSLSSFLSALSSGDFIRSKLLSEECRPIGTDQTSGLPSDVFISEKHSNRAIHPNLGIVGVDELLFHHFYLIKKVQREQWTNKGCSVRNRTLHP